MDHVPKESGTREKRHLRSATNCSVSSVSRWGVHPVSGYIWHERAVRRPRGKACGQKGLVLKRTGAPAHQNKNRHKEEAEIKERRDLAK